MDNFFVVSFLFWPAVVLVCAGLNMLISWTFSWAELVFSYLIGVVAGIFLHMAMQADPHAAVTFFFIFSHGLFGILYAFVDPFREAFSENTTFLWAMAGIRVGCTVWAAAFDHISAKLDSTGSWGAFGFSWVLAPVKLPWALTTTAVGLLIWIAGLFSMIKNGKVGFAGGVFTCEFDPTDTSGYHATTVGMTVHCWFGPMPFKHELYHTRQYIYMGDWMIPFWCVGIIWGLVSAAITGGDAKELAFGASSQAGNPIEVAPHELPGT